MKKLLTLILFSGMAVGASAQLVNNGGTITIQQGATLVVESDITNSGTGTITNNGIIEVKGDVTSAATATFTSATDSKLKFSGDTPSTVNFMAATTLADVEMAKTAEDVTLASALDIDGDLTFTENDNQIILGANDLVLSATSAADNAAVTNSFIVTDGAGVVTKEALSTAFEFPVGAAIDSQNDITLTEGGTADNISVRVLADAYDTPATQMDAMTEDVVSATWEITEATMGGSDITAAPSWVAADETATFDNTDAAVYQLDGTSYTALAVTGASSAANGISSISNAGLILDGTDYLIVGDGGLSKSLLEVKVFLEGAYVATDGMMHDKLRTIAGGQIPTAEPYTAIPSFTHYGDGGSESVASTADFDFAADGDDIVDWIFVELRSDATTIVETVSGLLQRDGDIVNVEGNPIEFASLANGDYFIVVKHRNHLGVRSNSAVTINKGGLTEYDFSTSASQALGSQQTELETGVYGVYGGNVNNEIDNIASYRFIRMTGSTSASNDYESLRDKLSGNPASILPFVYDSGDLNMDGFVRMTGSTAASNDYEFLRAVLNGNPATAIFRVF